MGNELADKMKNVFSDAAILTFAKMTSVDLVPAGGRPDADTKYDLSAVIGFTGSIIGNCALRFSAVSAQAAVDRLAGETVESPLEIADGVGELVNMIAGNAKAALVDRSISLSFPEVVRGRGHELGFSRHPSIIEIYFTSEIGNIALIVAFSENNTVQD
jgi:chemotaxis protein CheX